MKTRNYQIIGRTILIAGIICSLLLITLPPSPMQAMLPPRYTPTPAGSPDANDGDKPGKRIGAYIELQVRAATPGLWTIVQWQDSAGGWHDVEGWQGAFDEGNKKMWWVEAKDLGTGPFRWAIYQGQNGPLLASSESFHLPHRAGEILRVEVQRGPQLYCYYETFFRTELMFIHHIWPNEQMIDDEWLKRNLWCLAPGGSV